MWKSFSWCQDEGVVVVLDRWKHRGAGALWQMTLTGQSRSAPAQSRPTCTCMRRISALWPAFIFTAQLYWDDHKCSAHLLSTVGPPWVSVRSNAGSLKKFKHALCFSLQVAHAAWDVSKAFSDGQETKTCFRNHKQPIPQAYLLVATSHFAASSHLYSCLTMLSRALYLNTGGWW